MFKRHQHNWLEVERVYVKPDTTITSINGSQNYHLEFFRELLMGVTSVIHRCDICGKLEEYRFIGKHDKGDK